MLSAPILLTINVIKHQKTYDHASLESELIVTLSFKYKIFKYKGFTVLYTFLLYRPTPLDSVFRSICFSLG